MVPCCRADNAPELDEATSWAEPVATATDDGTPRNIRIGVIRNPPPRPNNPETKPTQPLAISRRGKLMTCSAIGK